MAMCLRQLGRRSGGFGRRGCGEATATRQEHDGWAAAARHLGDSNAAVTLLKSPLP